MKKLLVTTAVGAALVAVHGAHADEHTFKIGTMATLEGTYTVLGEDGVRGMKTALAALWRQSCRQGRGTCHSVHRRIA